MPRRTHLNTHLNPQALRRPLPLLAAGVGALLALSLLSGCGGGKAQAVSVTAYPVTAAARTACARFVAALPRHVSDQARRRTTGSAYAGAWGDPAIVLRCGVGHPAGYTNSSPCMTRNGIDWFVPPLQIDDLNSAITMTLVHRRPWIQVQLPASYRPDGPANVMADLDSAIRAHTTVLGHCQ